MIRLPRKRALRQRTTKLMTVPNQNHHPAAIRKRKMKAQATATTKKMIGWLKANVFFSKD